LEQHRDLYTTFVDLPKAFDTVSRDGLCKTMSKFGCHTNSSLSFASSWRACKPKSLMMMNCQILSQSPTAQARLCPCPYIFKLDVLCYAERPRRTFLPTVQSGATAFVAEPMQPKITELMPQKRNTRCARPELQSTSKPEGSIPRLAPPATFGHTNSRNSWGCHGLLRLRRRNN
ncbi:unnamed protein product, partial [Porites lobata]